MEDFKIKVMTKEEKTKRAKERMEQRRFDAQHQIELSVGETPEEIIKAEKLSTIPEWKKKLTSSFIQYRAHPRLGPGKRSPAEGYVKPELVDTRSNRDKLKDKKRAEKAAKIRHR